MSKEESTSKYNICFTDQATGMKIKLIHNLLKGNICLANDKMQANSDIQDYVVLMDESNLEKQMSTLIIDFEKLNLNKNKIKKLYNPIHNSNVFLDGMGYNNSSKLDEKYLIKF